MRTKSFAAPRLHPLSHGHHRAYRGCLSWRFASVTYFRRVLCARPLLLVPFVHRRAPRAPVRQLLAALQSSCLHQQVRACRAGFPETVTLKDAASSSSGRGGGYDSIEHSKAEKNLTTLLDTKLPSSSPFQLPLPRLPTSRTAPSREIDQIRPVEDPVQHPAPAQSRGPASPGKGKKSRRTSLPFPSLPSRGDGDHSVETPARHSRKYSFYTAAWGSPYDLPPSSETHRYGRRLRSRSNDFAQEDEYSYESGVDFTEDHSSFLELSGSGPRTPPRGLVPALDLDQTPSLQSKPYAPRNVDALADWSDASLTSGSDNEDDRSPGSRRARISGKTALAFSNVPKGHRSRVHHPTLTQQDFDSLLGPRPERAAQGLNMLPSTLRRESANSDKPLPPAPHMRTASESPVLLMNNTMVESPTKEKRPSITTTASFQRPKKKLTWRGKPCIVALPLEDGKHEDGAPKTYLKPEEVSAILRKWETDGYDTAGFNLAPLDAVAQTPGGRSRNSYPDPHETQSQLERRQFRVSIPDRKAWEDYVRELQEAKLRSLGVLAVDEDPPPSKSPAPSTSQMSRQASSQTSFVQSAPGLPLSANSLRSPLDARLSPTLVGGVNPFARPPSVVSPGSQPGASGFHLSRQSMAMPMNQFLGNEPHFPPTVSPLNGTFQQQFAGSGPVSRGISPLVDSRSQSRRATLSPVSPMLEQSNEFFPGAITSLPHLRHQSVVHPAFSALRPQQPDTMLNTQGHDEPARYFSQSHIASPLPHGHRHNVSESLQREIDEAESQLEATIGKQLEEEDAAQRLSPAEQPKQSPSSAQPTQPPLETTSQTAPAKMENAEKISDAETNPSLRTSPKPVLPADGSAQVSTKSPAAVATRKTSSFVFDPTKSFTPSFGSNVFTFGTPPAQNGTPEARPAGLHSKTVSNTSSFGSGFNVSAPAFVPGKPFVPQPTTREFSFTQSLPALKADAPVFVPTSGLGITTNDESQSSEPPPIFPNFNFADIIKQPKKSKAVPIVPPTIEDSESEIETVEDEMGRTTQAEGRQKRAKRRGVSGDQVPKFATPTPEPAPVAASPILQKVTPEKKPFKEEIVSPLVATGHLKTLLDDLPESTASGASSGSEEIRKSSANGSERETHSKTSSIKSGLDALSPTGKLGHSMLNGNAIEPTLPEPKATPTSVKPKLSATAKPFHFNPLAGSFSPQSYQPSPPQPSVLSAQQSPLQQGSTPEPAHISQENSQRASQQASQQVSQQGSTSSSPRPAPPPKKPIFSTGLGASRFAPSPNELPKSPPESPTPAPARASEDTSMESRIMNGVSYVEPTYQEIDEVVQRLYNEDSDLGIERNPAEAWRRSSPPIHHSRSRNRSFSGSESGRRQKERLVTTASPNRLRQPFQYLPEQELGSSYDAVAELVAKSARYSPSYKEPRDPPSRQGSVQKRRSSEWGSSLSSGDEERINARSGFFDARVHEVVGNVVDKRLQPLEENLSTISTAIAQLTKRSRSRRLRRSASADVEHSDADDEDEDSVNSRAVSPMKDRRFEKLRHAMLDAITTQQATATNGEIASLKDTLAELKASIDERPATLTPSTAVSDELKDLRSALIGLQTTMAEKAAPENVSIVPDELKEMRVELAELKTAFAERPVESTSSGNSDEIKLMHDTLAALKSSFDQQVSHNAPSTVSDQLRDMHSTVTELKAALAQQQERTTPIQTEVPEHNQLADLVAAMKGLFAQQQERAIIAQPESADHQQLVDSITSLKESLAIQQDRSVPEQTGDSSQAQLMASIATLQASLQEHTATNMTGDLKGVIEETISKQLRGKSGPVTSSQEAAAAEKLQLQASGLETMLKVAESRAEEELQSRRAVEDALADSERKLKAALADAAQYRESAEETEKSLKTFLDDQQKAKQHTASLEEVKGTMEKTIADLGEKIGTLEDTLNEYRQTRSRDKKELEESRSHVRGLDEENQNLDRTLRSLKTELEDSVKNKQSLRTRFDKLQEDMANTARRISQEQSSWRHKESEHKARFDLQTARLEAEARTRERLEMEIDRLEKQEKDAMKAKFLVEQIRGENTHLVGMVNNLRTKNHELQEHANKHQRELHDVKESNRSEINRIMNSTKADVAAANQQVELLRSNLENVIERLEAEVDQQKIENKNTKQRYESLLEEASKSRDTALREAAEARDASLQEHYRFHEHTLEETKAVHTRTIEEIHAAHRRAIEELEVHHQRATEYNTEDHSRTLESVKAEHERAMKAVTDEKRNVESQLQGRIALADETAAHLREHTTHLEERLEIAKSAAQAAAEAAKAARASTPQPPAAPTPGRSTSARASMPMAEGSELPEKISPQALRESIMVLQEQLHQRESQIESLEEELDKVDKDAPNKIKEREIEITWLRELLGVRLDDLQDIIQQLSQPSFDHDAVRDAAIRLKANLQMEQQEKERAMAGGQRFPSLSAITASPRSLPMAAAAAWGSWRKGQSTLGSLAEMAAPIAGGSSAAGAPSPHETPSRTASSRTVSSPQSFLSGLLTPPSTTVRQTPSPATPTAARSTHGSTRPLRSYATPKRPHGGISQDRRRPLASAPAPSTPPAIPLQADDYDVDAQSEHYSLDQYVNDSDDAALSSGAATPLEVQPPPPVQPQPRVSPRIGQSVELQAEMP